MVNLRPIMGFISKLIWGRWGIGHPNVEPLMQTLPNRSLTNPLRLLYSKPFDPLWASYPAVDMGKMKVKISTDAELAEKERKKKEKKAAQKPSRPMPSQNPKPTPGGTVLVQPKDLTLATSVKKSPPQKRQRQVSPRPKAKISAKLPKPPRGLRLEDNSFISADPKQATLILDSLMTRHDRVILKGMSFEEIS
ncbi:hypothetical protein FNV43_RR08434 [Rhamnella rubrinervis]|uniref:Uncharacterized protein n=1 Tax=Rhamnella rubrinervis TaxID=2594499 RepID=A0A8K0H8K5_9ROSA|nr:hypothetical protein FNV43_RR08434 [Rhamnella rubrinervis]